mgnify:CR=1 FL=1
MQTPEGLKAPDQEFTQSVPYDAYCPSVQSVYRPSRCAEHASVGCIMFHCLVGLWKHIYECMWQVIPRIQDHRVAVDATWADESHRLRYYGICWLDRRRCRMNYIDVPRVNTSLSTTNWMMACQLTKRIGLSGNCIDWATVDELMIDCAVFKT